MLRRLRVTALVLAMAASTTAADDEAADVVSQDLFEDRPTASEVNDIILPYLIGQKAHPTDGFELPATDVWWAWRLQYNMAIEQPVTNVMHLAAHNAYNSLGDGFVIFPALAPNQILGITELLDFGARLVEIDIHDTDSGFLEVFHAWDIAGKRDFVDVLAEISSWIDANPNEIVFLDIEDATEVPEGTSPDTAVDLALRSFFGDPAAGPSKIFTPQRRALFGRWPSRQELLASGARVVVFTHRNDSGDGRFGVPVPHTDSNGHTWYGAGLAFRANGGSDPVADRGNFRQFKVQDLGGAIASDPALLANPNFFLSMQSDGIDQIPPVLIPHLLFVIPLIVDHFTEFDANRARPVDARMAARNNVNFLKMDFLFGHDEDADLGSNTALFGAVPYVRDDAYEIEDDGSRVKRLEHAIWSWAKDDPAVQRQIFQDLTPGDGSGSAQRTWVAELMSGIGEPTFVDDLETRGWEARGNGRDFAVQGSLGLLAYRRWQSVTEYGTRGAGDLLRDLRFALRSKSRDPATGRYRWKLSTTQGAASDVALIDPSELVDMDGFEYVFAAPVNGLQNEDLFEARVRAGEGAPVWLNVNDVDRDGTWTPCPCATTIDSLVVTDPTVEESARAQLSLRFRDQDAFDVHTIVIDWGDGSAPDVVVPSAGERAVIADHVYADDDPSGTAADAYTISVEIDDGLTPPAVGSGVVTVSNVPPVITAFPNPSPQEDPTPSGEPVTLAVSFSDVGVLDSHGGEVDWGDGTATAALVEEAGGTGSASSTHAYSSGGVFDVLATVQDDDTGAVSASTSVFITGVGVQNGTLQIVGTPGSDVITVHREDSRAIVVHASFLEDIFQRFDPVLVERIEIFVCGAEDQINVAGSVRDIEVVVRNCASQ